MSSSLSYSLVPGTVLPINAPFGTEEPQLQTESEDDHLLLQDLPVPHSESIKEIKVPSVHLGQASTPLGHPTVEQEAELGLKMADRAAEHYCTERASMPLRVEARVGTVELCIGLYLQPIEV